MNEILTTECQCALCLEIRRIQGDGLVPDNGVMISRDRLKEAFDYDPITGIFRWKNVTNTRIVPGDIAGSVYPNGYIYLQVDGGRYEAHRLVFLYEDGYMPEGQVDHINRKRWDNRRCNLRDASLQGQQRNCGMRRDNMSGVKGVSWFNPTRKWIAYIGLNGKNKHLGYHETLLDAAYARYAAEQCLGFQDCDINSSARKYINAAVSENLR